MTVPVGGATVAAQPSLLQAGTSFAALACGIWILVECGFLKGTDGDNQYGPEVR